MSDMKLAHKFLWITVFGITMGYFEAAVVVYLRAIFYPGGFSFPLTVQADHKIVVEVIREVASLVMLIAVSHLTGKKFWERFAYFMILFGVWDICYYVWLKILLGWPVSLLDWDVLFLIPLPWIAPVVAPVSIALIMIVFGVMILVLIQKGHVFRPAFTTYLLAVPGVGLVLYSFMHDLAATLHQHMPGPYRYSLLIAGHLLFIAAFTHVYLKTTKQKG